jgi:polyribonucleotide nucleotidyltransferase
MWYSPAKPGWTVFALNMERVQDQPQRAQYGVIDVGKDSVRRVIGHQGSNIRALQEESGARLVVQDDGKVHLYAPSKDQYAASEALLEGFTGADVKVRVSYHAAHEA